ncbi:hypothetical protein HMN09_00845200 [Mycena chlorophos]|uniref:Uncharacterized protein n=1 Tax=Mycena chlorophos TaxID=658473 RepID=A0A8H6SQY4_MYCCL|nr:hypothetical protein HMN09_00845200 [Mycena chlorophos]
MAPVLGLAYDAFWSRMERLSNGDDEGEESDEDGDGDIDEGLGGLGDGDGLAAFSHAPRKHTALNEEQVDDRGRNARPFGAAHSLPSTSHLPPTAQFESQAKDRQRARRRKKRKTKREEEQAASGSNVKPFCAKRTAQASRRRVEIDLDSSAAQEPVASTGFVCLSDPTLNNRREKAAKDEAKKAEKRGSAHKHAPTPPLLLPTAGKFSKAQLEDMGMTEDAWGRVRLFKSQVVYVDSKGRELAVLCGQPRDTATSDWGRQVAQAGFELMQQLAPKLSPLDSDSDAVADGRKKKKKQKKEEAERLGMGAKGPQNFHNEDKAELDTLLTSTPFTRIAGFSDSILSNFAPRLYGYYQQTMDALFSWDPRLRRIFPHGTSVFPSATFNFGPQTVTVPHLDLLNLAWGWCFITALGDFDPTKGGHLILWDLKRFIRFPPGRNHSHPVGPLTTLQLGGDTDVFFFHINGPEIKTASSLINGPEIRTSLSLINGPEIRTSSSFLINGPEIRTSSSFLINGPEIRTASSLINGPEIRTLSSSLINGSETPNTVSFLINTPGNGTTRVLGRAEVDETGAFSFLINGPEVTKAPFLINGPEITSKISGESESSFKQPIEFPIDESFTLSKWRLKNPIEESQKSSD